MKLYYLTSAFLLFCCPLSAQAEYPFLTDGKQWVQDEFYSDGSNPSTLTYFEFALGDTVMMDGVVYTQLIGDTTFVSHFSSGLLREAGGRLLMLRDEEIDTLLDFNMEVGDTLIIEGDRSEPERTQHMVLLSIDSVTVVDGSIRKRLNFELNNVWFDGGGFGVSWIDGIGSTRGTIYNSFCSTNTLARSSGSCQSELICVKDANERLLYNSTEDEIYDCNKVDVISSNNTYQLPEGTFKVYPNPATDILNISSSGNYRIARIRLVDVNGRKVIDRNLNTGAANSTHIQLGDLKKGIYSLTIFTLHGEWVSQLIVVQ